MMITAEDLGDIEDRVGRDCTASVRIGYGGAGLRVSVNHPKSGQQLTYEQIISPESAHAAPTEHLLLEFAAGARQFFDREISST